MPDIFLSYSREDQVIARRFAEGLEREGLSVWWDQALNPGEAFDQVTEQALEAARAVIVLWSKNSVASRWVRAEATQANADGRLVPVMVENCKRPIMFELTHTVDLSQWKGNADDPAWQAFVASVRRFVQRTGSAEAGGLPVPPTQPAPPLPMRRERAAASVAALRVAATRVGSLLYRYRSQLACALLGAVIAGCVVWKLRQEAEPEAVHISIDAPEIDGGTALSPDGKRFVYVFKGKLWSRRWDQAEPTAIPGGDGAKSPFFSPDGRSVAFDTSDQSGSRLKAFDFGSETVRVLADLKGPTFGPGAWDSQGRIFFIPAGTCGLWRVPARGGEPELLASRADNYQECGFLGALPDSDWVLFNARSAQAQPQSDDTNIVAQNTVTGERKVVVKRRGLSMGYLSGRLLFTRGSVLYSVAFDARRAATRGPEVPVVQGAGQGSRGDVVYAVTANGTLLYAPVKRVVADDTRRSVVRVSPAGKLTRLSAEFRNYSNPRASPDGSRIAVEVTDNDQHTHIWVMDVKSGAATQVTFDGDEDRFPVWTADGRDILFTSRRGEEHAIWRQPVDGSGAAIHVLDGTALLLATDVHGHTLIYQEHGGGGSVDVFALDLDGKGPPQPLLATPDWEFFARVSPDGAWISYTTVPAGAAAAEAVDRLRVWVRPFPGAASGGQRAVSEGKGTGSLWSATGHEIYYLVPGNPIQVMVATLAATPAAPTLTGRRGLFGLNGLLDTTPVFGAFFQPIDPLPKSGDFVGVAQSANLPGGADGSQADTAAPARLNLVLNWGEELKKLVPAN